MAFRATAFNDAKVVDLLKTHFVCVGIAHNGAGRRKDAEGDFARKLIGKGGTLQGLHVINTAGDLVGYVYDFRPQSVTAMLEKALKSFKAVEAPAIDFKEKDKRFTMPDDGLVVFTIAKVLAGHDPVKAANPAAASFQRQRRCIFAIYCAGASGIRAELTAPTRRITPLPDPRAGSPPPKAWRG